VRLQATLLESHEDTLQDKLNLDQYLIKTLLGPVTAARPNNTAEWLGHFGDNLNVLQNNSTQTNKLGHILGAVLTSLPIGQGGVNPYTFIPSCITSAGSHMYHDEVRPDILLTGTCQAPHCMPIENLLVKAGPRPRYGRWTTYL
jgi:hypothetical protein